LTRLASRTKVRKEESVRVRLRLHQNTVAQWTEQHVALVRELAAVRRLQHQQTNLHTQRYVYQVRNSVQEFYLFLCNNFVFLLSNEVDIYLNLCKIYILR